MYQNAEVVSWLLKCSVCYTGTGRQSTFPMLVILPTLLKEWNHSSSLKLANKPHHYVEPESQFGYAKHPLLQVPVITGKEMVETVLGFVLCDWSDWTNSVINLETTSGFCTWGIWPHWGIWRSFALGISQCNRWAHKSQWILQLLHLLHIWLLGANRLVIYFQNLKETYHSKLVVNNLIIFAPYN